MQYWFPSVTVKYCTFLFVILPINMCKCNCSVNYQRLNTFTKVNAISFMQWIVYLATTPTKKEEKKKRGGRGRYLVIHSRFLLGKSALTDILSSNTCRLLIESRSGSPPLPPSEGPRSFQTHPDFAECVPTTPLIQARCYHHEAAYLTQRSVRY